MYAEPKNVSLVSVQKGHFAVWTCKKTCFMQPRIRPTVQICGNSGLPIAMIPCWNQWNVYIKSRLRVCRAQKCNPSFGLKTPPRIVGLRRTLFHAAQYRADSTNLREFEATYHHGTVFAPMECLYQKEAKCMQNPKMYPLFRCKKATSQYGPAKNPVSYSLV